MTKRDVTETIYEYDKEGKLIRKTVTETHEEEESTLYPYPYTYPFNPCPNTPLLNDDLKQPYITWCNETGTHADATQISTSPTETNTTTTITG